MVERTELRRGPDCGSCDASSDGISSNRIPAETGSSDHQPIELRQFDR